MTVRESRYHLELGEGSRASAFPAWRGSGLPLLSQLSSCPALGQMSSVSFDLLPCEVTSSLHSPGLLPGLRTFSHLPEPQEQGG